MNEAENHLKKLCVRNENINHDGVTCCLACHFSYEEKFFHLLPVSIQLKLRKEHKELAEKGYPVDEVLAHSKGEMQYFRKYFPKSLIERIEVDHLNYCMNKNEPYTCDQSGLTVNPSKKKGAKKSENLEKIKRVSGVWQRRLRS